MKLVQLRRKVLASLALAGAAVPAACAAPAEEDVGEGQGASSASESEALTCDESINKVDDIRNRFLDERHSAVWAFQADAPSAFAKLASAPGEVRASLVSSLEGVTYERWTPSAKVRVRDARLATTYVVVRGKEKSGGSKVVLLVDATLGTVLATGRAPTSSGIWSWSCPPQTGVRPPCQNAPQWSNWPNWGNWHNWQNGVVPC